MDLEMKIAHSMDTLEFHWFAFFDDGSELRQFSSREAEETPFKEVQEKLHKLSLFILKHRFKDIQFSVDVKNGIVCSDDTAILDSNLVKSANKIRLVYCRRNTIQFGSKMQQLSHTIQYILGYQYNDDSGLNHKAVIKIDSDGTWVIGE